MATDSTDQPPLGPRHNWWYEATGHPGHGETPAEDTATSHPRDHARARAEWLAHRILKQSAPKLICPIAAHEPPRQPGGRTAQLFAWLLKDEHLEHNPDAIHTENTVVELTPPQAYLPPRGARRHEAGGEAADETRPYRVNEEHGYLTGPAIPDRPTEEFLATVDIVLQHARERRGLREATATRIRTLARDRKRHADEGGDRSDVAIMTEVLECIEHPERVLEAKGY